MHPPKRTEYTIGMTCCDELARMMDRELVRVSPLHLLRNGRILTEIDTEYFLVFGDERPSYVGMNYCPFCGRALSRGLWNLEKKKQG
ncbi:MAG: hypothetical protein WD696_01505 [Bryobacteraceae bacterium]